MGIGGPHRSAPDEIRGRERLGKEVVVWGHINSLGEGVTGATSSELMVETPRASPTETRTEETIDKLT